MSLEAYIGSGTEVDLDKPWYSARKPRQKRSPMDYGSTEYKLYDLIGKSYDDPLWDKLLNQLTYAEMRYLIGTGNFNTAELKGIGKPKTTDPDGPAGFTNFMTVIDTTATVYDTCFYASECVIAATLERGIGREMGKAVGDEALVGNERGDGRPYSGWYAPSRQHPPQPIRRKKLGILALKTAFSRVGWRLKSSRRQVQGCVYLCQALCRQRPGDPPGRQRPDYLAQ